MARRFEGSEAVNLEFLSRSTPRIGASEAVDPFVNHHRSTRPAIEDLELNLARSFHVGPDALHRLFLPGHGGGYAPVGAAAQRQGLDRAGLPQKPEGGANDP